MTGRPETPDPWRGFRGVMAATLILEAIAVLLALPVVGMVGGGLTPTALAYLIGFVLVLVLLMGMQGRSWAIWANLGVQLVLVAGFLLLLFRRTIAGRLTRLADYVQHIDISRGEPPPLVLDCPPAREPDEMDRVATALNGLGRSGARAFADLRLQEQRLRLFFDAANEAIFGVDPAGRCTFVNRAGAEFFAVDRPEALVGLDLLTRTIVLSLKEIESGYPGYVSISEVCTS